MIPCSIQNLEQRCRERGYTLDQVRACIVDQRGDAIIVDETHQAYPKPPPSKPVSFVTKVVNFATAAAQHVAAGAPACTDQQIAERHAICVACPHYQDEACGLCGCPIVREKNYLSKLSWADQSCPDNPPRWKAVTP